MAQATFNYAEAIRNQRDSHGKPTQTFTINGKTIKTNFGAYDYPYWNGNEIPMKYTHKERCGHNSSNDIMNKLIEAGYDEIRIVVLASGMIRGYCEMYFWAYKSKKAQNQPETAPETESKEINQPEPEKATESITEAHRICNDSCDNWNYYSGAWNKLRCVHCMEKRSTDDLRKERARMSKMNQKEYETRGNTKRCQGLFAQIELIDAEIERRTK